MFNMDNNTTNSAEDISDSSLGQQHCLLATENIPITVDLRYLLYGPTLCCIILFGCIGNILTFIVFYKRIWINMRRNTNWRRPPAVPKMHRYLALLSIWDLMLMVGSFFLYNLPYLMYGAVRMYGGYVRVYPYAYALACASRTGGIWILIASAVDRYFAVCHPFAHHVYSTTKLTNLVLLGCCGLSFVYGWPRYYHIILEDCFDLASEEWTIVAVGSDLRSHPVYWYAYKIAADFLLVSVGPFVILLYLSITVCLAVQKSTRSRRQSRNPTLERVENTDCGSRRCSNRLGDDENANCRFADPLTPIRRHEGTQRRRSHQETQNSLNFMLIAVLVKFLICHSLPAVLDVCETTMDASTFQTTAMDDLVHTANALVILNGSLNFVLYLACSPRFRTGVLQILAFGMKKRDGRCSPSTRLSQDWNRDMVCLGSVASVK